MRRLGMSAYCKAWEGGGRTFHLARGILTYLQSSNVTKLPSARAI